MIQSQQLGKRSDLAAFLRANRRSLKLRLGDKWGDIETPTHTFVSLLERKPFYTPGQGSVIQVGERYCFGLVGRILDWIVTPF